jgi:hypothetical protein
LDLTALGGNFFAVAASRPIFDLFLRGCQCNQGFSKSVAANTIDSVVRATSTEPRFLCFDSHRSLVFATVCRVRASTLPTAKP